MIQAAVATIAASAVAVAGRAHPISKPLDPTDPNDIALIYRKLAFSLDDKPGFWWLRGRRFGLVDADLTPLWDMHVGLFFRTRDNAASDTFDATILSVSFYTDIASGQYLSRAHNPYTGKTVAIPYGQPTAGVLRFNTRGRVESGVAPAGVMRDGAIGPAWIEADQVWVQGDYRARRDASPGAERIRVNDLATYFGAVRDIADPSIKSAPAGQVFSDINTWPDWLEMDGRPGSYYSRANGRKVAAYEQMPAPFREMMTRVYPEISRRPADFLNS